jgi:hypothetical protein
MQGKQIGYGVALVAIVGLTVFLFVRNSDARRQLPNDPESAQTYLCQKCEQVVKLTPRQVDEAVADRDRTRSGAAPTDASVLKMLVLACPACKEVSLVRAAPCPSCGKPYLRFTTDGERHAVCRDCEKLGNAAPGGAAENP